MNITPTTKVIEYRDVEVYLTLAGTYRAYVRGLSVDAWGCFKSTAVRRLIDNLIAQDIAFDFSEAPAKFFDK
jgi:hypothetical protein